MLLESFLATGFVLGTPILLAALGELDRHALRTEQARGRLGDEPQRPLDVAGRVGNRAQDLGGRLLLSSGG